MLFKHFWYWNSKITENRKKQLITSDQKLSWRKRRRDNGGQTIIDKQQKQKRKPFNMVKILNHIQFKNSTVLDKNGKPITNISELHDVLTEHFKIHFYDTSLTTSIPVTKKLCLKNLEKQKS